VLLRMSRWSILPFLFVLAFILSSQPSLALTAEPPVLIGLYTSGSLQETASEIEDINQWLSPIDQRVTIAGTFMDIEWPNPEYNVPTELDAAWDQGAIPFVNLIVGTITDPHMISNLPQSEGYPNNRTAAMVASDESLHTAIRSWAREFATWSNGGQKKAFLAPLPEMNGDWVPYGLSPKDFKEAFRRIREIFTQEGVPENAVSWVFAPNGWSDSQEGHPEFETYYPGNSLVDILAFSSYNFGTCVWSWPSWDTFEIIFLPYLDRMQVMAPSKPIFIAQTGTVDLGGDKNLWLRDTYTSLAAYPALRGIIYFHKRLELDLPCDPVDWRFYAPSEGIEFTGLLDALGNPEAGFGSWSLLDDAWEEIVFNPSLQEPTFEDVEASHPFAGVENVWYYSWVESLAEAELTDGCGPNPLTGKIEFCPTSSVTRAELAVFLLRGREGSNYTPPTPDGSAPFIDISGHWAENWIEALYDEGLTSGYEDHTYRPDSFVTRAEMAAFILTAKNNPSYSPPPPIGGAFNDVTDHWAEAWIEQLKQEGIVSGYPDGSYRPEETIRRAEIAVYVLRGFELEPF
jgi:hypothetical protein